MPKVFPSLFFEQLLWKDGCQWVGGVDEAGRGALAGPVAAAAVILPPEGSIQQQLAGVCDSKLMTPPERDEWAPRIRAAAAAWGVGFASAAEIDVLGILPATKLAALRALEALSARAGGLHPGHLLTDYLIFPELDLPQSALVKGDQISLSISAASVLAKTARDELMRALDGQYPGYQFARHKGYGTAIHLKAIRDLGRCEIHRKTFSAVLPGPEIG